MGEELFAQRLGRHEPDADRSADVVRDLGDELRILRRVARTRAVVEMRDVQHEPELLA